VSDVDEQIRDQTYTQHSVIPRAPSWMIVAGTLLVNIVIIWTPLVVLMTNRVAELEAVKTALAAAVQANT